MDSDGAHKLTNLPHPMDRESLRQRGWPGRRVVDVMEDQDGGNRTLALGIGVALGLSMSLWRRVSTLSHSDNFAQEFSARETKVRPGLEPIFDESG